MLYHRRDRISRSKWLVRLSWLLVLLLSLLIALGVGHLAYWFYPYSYSAGSSLLLSSQPDVVGGMVTGAVGQPLGGAEALVGATDTGAQERVWAILTSREMLLRLVELHDLQTRLRLSQADAILALESMTRFRRLGDVGVAITVTCRGARRPTLGALDSQQARRLCADLANSYLSELDHYVTEANLRQATQTREFLETSLHETQAQLHEVEAGLQQLQSAHGLLEPTDKVAQLLERLKTVEPAYAEAVARQQEAGRRLAVARRQVQESEALRVTQEVRARNPVLTSLEERIASLQVELRVAEAAGKTPQHRDLVRLQAELDSARDQLRQVREEVRQQVMLGSDPAHDLAVAQVIELEADLVGAGARQTAYERLRGSLRAEMAGLPEVSRRYVNLKREQEQHSALLEPLDRGLRLATLVERYSRASRFHPLDEAVPPAHEAGFVLYLAPVLAFLIALLALGLVAVYYNPLNR